MPKRNRSTRWRKREELRPTFHNLAEDDEEEQASAGLNLFGPTKRRMSSVDVHGSGSERNAEEQVCRISTEETERSKNGERFKGLEGEHIKNYEQQVMSVRTPEGFVRKSTWQVADVRRAGNDVFIGKNEACIMNRRKVKSVLGKEGNVYVLDLHVKVP